MSHHTSPGGRLRPWEPDSVPGWKQSTVFNRTWAGPSPALTGLSVHLSLEFVFSVWKNNSKHEGISMQGTEQASKEDNSIQYCVCLCSKLWKAKYYIIFRWSSLMDEVQLTLKKALSISTLFFFSTTFYTIHLTCITPVCPLYPSPSAFYVSLPSILSTCPTQL